MSKLWVTTTADKEHRYALLGGGYLKSQARTIATQQAKKIRAEHPELKHARIKCMRYHESEISQYFKIDQLVPWCR